MPGRKKCTKRERKALPCECAYLDKTNEIAEQTDIAMNEARVHCKNDVACLATQTRITMMIQQTRMEAANATKRKCLGQEPRSPFSGASAALQGIKPTVDVRFSLGLGAGLAVASILIWRLGGPIVGEIFAVTFGSVALLNFTGAAIEMLLVDDPPDEAYTEIPVPVFPTPPRLRATAGVDPRLVEAARSLLSELSQYVGWIRAIAVASDRAQTAEIAGDIASRDRQLAAIREFAAHAANSLARVGSARRRFFMELKAASIDWQALGITEDHYFQFRIEVIDVGFPKRFKRLASRLGINQADLELIRNRLIEELYEVRRLYDAFPNVLGSPSLARTEKQMVGALRQLAAGES